MSDLTIPPLYKVGGSLTFNHPSYVERQADRQLGEALRAGKFCYVFNCRQMGKSSLRVRTMHQLQAEGNSCASVDITSLGSDIDSSQWYNGIITQLFLSFNFVGKVNLKIWLRERDNLSPVQKLSQFLETVVLEYATGKQVFIFIDEIDKVLSLKFSLDDFFSLIRYCYNQRAEDARYNRLSFALFGVATPSDLIREKTQTPFNIGTAIALNGFSLAEIKPLALGLTEIAANPEKVLAEILNWTGGQPFLTQKVCALIGEQDQWIAANQEGLIVNQIIQSQIIEHWESQDEPVHLKTIRDRLLRNEQTTGRLLGLYQHILEKGQIKADDSSEQSELKLSGLVVKNDGSLIPYNRIYQDVFDLNWLHQQLAKIRPYSESIIAWEFSQYQDQSRLLRGQALKDALHWSADKNLSNLDYKFLNASQNQEQQEAEEANLILSQANQKAQKMIRIGLAFLVASLSGSIIAIVQANIAYQKQQSAQKGTELQRLGTSADRQFSFEQINGLLSAMQAGQSLKERVDNQTLLQNYPATSPILALQQILDRIQEKNILSGHQDGVTSVAFSPNGQQLASGSRDKTVRLWNQKGELKQILKGHQGSIYSVSFSPDGQTLATGSQDETIKLWNMAGKLIKTIKAHQGSIYAVNFSPDGRYFASASRDKTAKLWSRAGKLLATLKGAEKSVNDVKFSPDSRLLATVSRDGPLRLWNLQGKLLKEFSIPNLSFFSINFSPDGKTLVAAADDGTIKLWNLDGKLLATFKGHQELVSSVIFSADGQRVISASSDGTAKIWTKQGLEIETLRGDQEGVASVAINQQNLLAMALEDGTIKLWNLANKNTTGFKPFSSHLTGFAINPIQSQIAMTTADDPLTLFDLTGKKVVAFADKTQGLIRLIFSPDGQYLAGDAGGGEIQIWQIKNKLERQFTTNLGRLYNLEIHPNNQLMAIANRNGQVELWKINSSSPQLLKTIKADQDRIRSLSFNPQKPQFASSSEEGNVKLWDLNGNLERTWLAHNAPITQVEFAPDGQTLLTASQDGTAKLWSLNQTLIHTFKTDPLPIVAISFSPDRQWLATASNDGTIRLWDLAANLRAEFKGQDASIETLAFTRDSQNLISINIDGKVRQWKIEPELTRLEQLLNRGCQWLEDYFLTHSQERDRLSICK